MLDFICNSHNFWNVLFDSGIAKNTKGQRRYDIFYLAVCLFGNLDDFAIPRSIWGIKSRQDYWEKNNEMQRIQDTTRKKSF